MAAFGVAAEAFFFEFVEIGLPDLGLIFTEMIEIVPAVDTRVMQIVESDPDRVMSYRLDLHDADMAALVDDLLLRGAVALYFR